MAGGWQPMAGLGRFEASSITKQGLRMATSGWDPGTHAHTRDPSEVPFVERLRPQSVRLRPNSTRTPREVHCWPRLITVQPIPKANPTDFRDGRQACPIWDIFGRMQRCLGRVDVGGVGGGGEPKPSPATTRSRPMPQPAPQNPRTTAGQACATWEADPAEMR